MYRSLDISKSEFRILEVLPPDSADKLEDRAKIRTQLRYCTLNNPIPYQALSYTWGPLSNGEAIIAVDSTENVPVRRNLEKALRDLRSRDTSLLLWADALCINQADLDERREQVKLMRRIYTAASVVRTWIDLDIDLTDGAFSRLSLLSGRTSVHDLGNEPDSWGPVGQILANEYWSRIWIQQEIAYATKWKIQCRSSLLSSEGLMAFVTLLVLKGWGIFTDPMEDKAKWKALMPRPLRPLLYRSRMDNDGHSSSTFYGPLHRALRDCRNLNSTDPKDKVFAMLGMIDRYQENDIDINYACTDEEVYANVARLSIERHHSLDFLRDATLGNVADAHGGFPTWLPDWSILPTTEHLTSPSFSVSDLYPESQGLTYPPATITGQLLNLTGCLIGKVSSVLPKAQEEDLWTGMIDLANIITKLRYFKDLIDTIDVPVPGKVEDLDPYYSEYLFRAVTGADGKDIEPRRFQSYSRIFHDLLNVASAREDVPEEAVIRQLSSLIQENQDHFGDIVHYMQESTRGRQLALTEYLGMGLVPVQAVVGDEFWCILGCPTPLVLRRANEHYMVVGEAYLNDCMRWRILDGKLQTRSGLQLPDYQVQNLSLC